MNCEKQQKTNQDSLFVVKNFAKVEGMWYFGVCDGHGQNGHLVSQFVKSRLPLNIVDVDTIMKHKINSFLKSPRQEMTAD